MDLLCEPYLLDPRPGSVTVVWHTTSPGTDNAVLLGPAVAAADPAAALRGAVPGVRVVRAGTTPLPRMREDSPAGPVPRPVHRQLAVVDGLPEEDTPYRVVSVRSDGEVSVSGVHALRGAPPAGSPVRLLLTSDHQLGPMVPANLELAAETAGSLDGVLFAGDMVNVVDRASDWFDHANGRAFFAALGGRASWTAAGRTFTGAPLISSAPLYPAIGNHEVIGRWSATETLDFQFNDAVPDDWDVSTYEAMFPVPASDSGGPRWWARTVGDVYVVSLFGTEIWRPERSGTYQDGPHTHGRFIFAPIGKGSPQYEFLVSALTSAEARAARYRAVMFHHPSHGLGFNSVPAFTDPVPVITEDTVRYEYPLADDYVLRDLAPVFSAYYVNLVLNGHSHVWARFRDDAGVNWLETSNVGNTWGAFHKLSGRVRAAPAGPDYVLQGDPGGLEPVVPTVAPLTGPGGAPLPFVSSDEVTVFSVLDSAAGVVRSYRYDTVAGGDVLLFDEFPL
ncbi:metallophosphoesterase family protein [Catenuloplanes atrovinosus]|uniref:Calcineurin-like phosphoesterase domain-containing protein n=1 Tax=Catenuloplanes atrovinosus TaxID=137266 RepID=A0AAE3YJ32_9ACTN|nr:metallophosphoesterase [Catenuloplanes atrovinosus]MDR7273847.1 hypothetical protein [Catenuloplanes atrovinosus]